jgi:2-dehydropantoate 2-reductase
MASERRKIGIIGVGSMGTLFGYHLARDCDVVVLDSNAATMEAIRAHGLALNGEPPRQVTVARSSRELFDVHVLFLFVKAVDTLRALRPFAGELNPVTPIVSLQNGVGNEDAIKTALGGAVPVILGVTTESAITTAPGVARSSVSGTTLIGSASASPAISRQIADLLTQSGLQATTVYDIRPHLWGKLVANAAINAISALLGCNAGDVPRDPSAAHLAESLAEEAAAVAAALKINLPFGNPWQYVMQVVEAGADSPSSMAFDVQSGHPSEIDHINGAVVAFGRRAGVPTPYNDAMVRLVKAREAISARERS